MLNQRLELLLGESKWLGINLAEARLPNYSAQSRSYWDPSLGSVVFTTRLEEPTLVDRFVTGLTYRVCLETIPEPVANIHPEWTPVYASFDWLEPFLAGWSTSTRELSAGITVGPDAKTESPAFETPAPHDEIAADSNNGKDGQLFDPIYGSALLAIRKGIVERGAPRHFIGSVDDLTRDEDLDEPLSEVADDFAEEPYRPEFGRGPFRPQKR
jgi:hypothetical protein